MSDVCNLKWRKVDLEGRLANADVDILMLQATWLCEAVEEARIPDFYLVGRIDCTVGSKACFEGVAIYARKSVANIDLLLHLYIAEIMWCIFHSYLCVVLLGIGTGHSAQTTRPYCFSVRN